jgi:WD40 repeat protein
VRLWDTASGAQKQVLKGHCFSVAAVIFSPDGQTVASASFDKTVRLWDTASGAQKQVLKGHDNLVTAVIFSPDGQTVASASNDNTVRLWDTASGAQKQVLKSDVAATYLSFSVDGYYLNSDRGSLLSGFPPSDSSNNPIFVDRKWIRQKGQHLIWLPPNYRATFVLARESTVILGHQSGALTFLWLSLG